MAVDPFTPGPTTDPTAGLPNPNDFENLRSQWSTFLDQPGARAALLQTGIALMQTPGFGQTPAGQIGAALGAGAEAATRSQLVGSKLDVEEAKGEALRARNLASQAGMEREQLRQSSMNERAQNQNMLRARQQYAYEDKAVKDHYQKLLKQWGDAEKNRELTGTANPYPKPTEPPSMSFEQWLQYNGMKFGISPLQQKIRAQTAKAEPDTTDEEGA